MPYYIKLEPKSAKNALANLTVGEETEIVWYWNVSEVLGQDGRSLSADVEVRADDPVIQLSSTLASGHELTKEAAKEKAEFWVSQLSGAENYIYQPSQT